ncbi:hypothetical protein DCC85_17920 [Paenibacillus sp. CAA11]|uniref:Cthe_2314 family HEPN domain-containing protein n=1 Tax=Paenibacillus sp. CAA11 TaxID=1532905 RepID=UPI000D368B9E|nr:Cthe_2314 family HEPN domain-containing protein [Paenibacillus sp. CAA11]AWB45880.1 hypothetical protein DCC85_17920 [Paenibacillus sp. CAA11]
MLRTLLGEPPRENEGLLQDAMNAMVETLHKLEREMDKNDDPTHDYRRLEIWTRGLISSIDELEQSAYAAAFFRKKVTTDYIDEMQPQEKSDYARYVYFYKDGFIRLFSLLDKLGTLLNDLYELNTAKVKPHFSYFTVLRQFRYLKVHLELGNKLSDLKEKYKEPLGLLRRRRNTEIHYMNSEMQDDLWQRHRTLHGKIELEDLDKHLKDLADGCEMVFSTVFTVFDYTNKNWRKAKP